MKNDVLVIMKKELTKYFSNRRLLFSTIILPGLLIYLIYSFMGIILSNQVLQKNDYRVNTINMPYEIELFFNKKEIEYEKISDFEIGKKELMSNKIDALLIFPQEFDVSKEYNKDEIPNVKIFYDSASKKSYSAFHKIVSVLNLYEETISNKFDINNKDETYDLATKEKKSGQFFAKFLPLMLIVFLFTGCMVITPDTIAGEKERGTLTILLLAPIKREAIVFGKILATVLLSLLSALSTGIGAMGSLLSISYLQKNINLYYNFIHYIYLLLIIFSVVLLFVSTIALFSTIAKTIKEAQSYVTPFMVVVSLIGITSMFSQVNENSLMYFIPVYNAVQSFGAILSFNINHLNIIITLLSNLLYTVILVKIMSKMFIRENIIFS